MAFTYTFQGIKDELEERLSLLSEWQDILPYGVYDNLFDATSYGINRHALYPAETYYRESFLKTATKYDSVIPRAEYLSYTPHRKQGASGTVQISGDSTFSSSYVYVGNNVIIPKWTSFSDETGNINIYSTSQYTYYRSSVGDLDISVKQGTPKEFSYVASGSASETITVHSPDIDNDEIEIFIVDSNGNVLHNVNILGIDVESTRMFFISDLDNYYCEIQNSYDFQSTKFVFGDGINQKKLTSGEIVLIKYADTDGDQGNIQQTGVIASIKDTIYDNLGNEATLYVTNSDEISDGTDYETIESIVENSTNLFGTGYRCGGYDDWVTIVNAHPYVYTSKIWSTDDVADDTITNDQNKIFITAISNDGNALTQDQKDDITINYLKDKKTPTEVVSWQSLNVIFAIFRVEGIIQTDTPSIVSSQIDGVLEDTYGILNTDFKVNIYESNFTRLIDNLSNVVRHDTEIYHMEKDFNYNTQNHTILVSNTSTNESDSTKQIYLLEDSLEIWLKNNLTDSLIKIAYDDSGTITAYNNTYVDILLPENKIGTDSTGLANDATVYTASCEISGGGAQPISIVGSSSQTIDDLVTELNSDITDGIATFTDGDDYIRISVTTLGNSTITFTDTDLVTNLFSGGTTVGTPVDSRKYTVINDNITYSTNTISFTISDLAATPPDDFELNIIYKTQDGSGEQINDIRLPVFNLITDVDIDYNTYNLEFETN